MIIELGVVCVHRPTVCGYGSNLLQVTFSTSQHVLPDSADAMDYRTVTNLRVQLFDQFVELELSGSSFQYYALSEWLIWGSCLCNGHASMCTPGSGEMLENNRVSMHDQLTMASSVNILWSCT